MADDEVDDLVADDAQAEPEAEPEVANDDDNDNNDDNDDDDAKDEPQADPEPEPEPEAPKEEEKKEEPKEEPKTEPIAAPKKKGKKKGKKKSKKAPQGDPDDEARKAWNRISAKKNDKAINWYICKLKGKAGKSTKLVLAAEGKGGVSEMVEFLKDKEKGVMFGLIRCKTTDDAMSVRGKFIYVRFIGSTVGSITKAKLTTSLGKIDDQFPCKHLTCDINEKCEGDLEPSKLAIELLRVGGAHKPDQMDFGPDQVVDVKTL